MRCGALGLRDSISGRCPWPLFSSDIAGILVPPPADESGVPKVMVARPLQKLELSDQDWLQPPEARPLCLRQALAPSTTLRFRQIRERTFGDF